MQPTRFRSVVGATLVVLALVAHLWMLDAPTVRGHGTPVGDEVSLVGFSSPATQMTGCPTGMDACRVPLPGDPLLLLLVTAMLLTVHVRRPHDPERAGTSSASVGAATERAPPGPPVASSVVLLE